MSTLIYESLNELTEHGFSYLGAYTEAEMELGIKIGPYGAAYSAQYWHSVCVHQ